MPDAGPAPHGGAVVLARHDRGLSGAAMLGCNGGSSACGTSTTTAVDHKNPRLVRYMYVPHWIRQNRMKKTSRIEYLPPLPGTAWMGGLESTIAHVHPSSHLSRRAKKQYLVPAAPSIVCAFCKRRDDKHITERREGERAGERETFFVGFFGRCVTPHAQDSNIQNTTPRGLGRRRHYVREKNQQGARFGLTRELPTKRNYLPTSLEVEGTVCVTQI